MNPDCPFCRVLAGLESQPPDKVVWRFPHSIAVLGPWQYYAGYCILMSRRHARELSELPDDVRRDFLEEMCVLARAIELACRPHKLNYEMLGNQVPHLHWHLFPRSKDDPAVLSPVWLAIDASDRDPELRKRLEAEQVDRSVLMTSLRQALTALKAAHA
jgi:diadenosine tetraphosphate (Ap4A) HIT family hydrolase